MPGSSPQSLNKVLANLNKKAMRVSQTHSGRQFAICPLAGDTEIKDTVVMLTWRLLTSLKDVG